MNNTRRRKLDECIEKLGTAQYTLEQIQKHLEAIKKLKEDINLASFILNNTLEKIKAINEEEYNARLALPDNLDSTDMAFAMDAAVEHMDAAEIKIDSIFQLLDNLDDIYTTKFIATYDPSELIDTIDKIDDEIETTKDEIEDAKYW